MSELDAATPKREGFVMPAEWSPHAATLMAWPLRSDYWEGRAEDARREWAGVARAVASSEPVVMVCNPGDEASVRVTSAATRSRCCRSRSTTRGCATPVRSSCATTPGRSRPSRSASTRGASGSRRGPTTTRCLPAVAAHLGVRLFEAPFVLEGGSILTDGEGTLLTTEMCLLSPNRNPDLTKDEIERGLRDYLGVDAVVWLPYGMAGDVGPVATDGHVDGVAAYVAPGRVALLVPDDARDADHDFGRANLERLEASTDARGRSFEVEHLIGADGKNAYSNCYIANRIVVAPLTGADADERGRRTAREALPRPRGDRRAGRHDRVRRRRPALHHAAGARLSRTLERR